MTEQRTPRLGLDIGTYHICSARMQDDKLDIKKEVNAFFTVPLTNKFMLNMIKQSGAPVIEVDNFAYILGDNARQLALSMGSEYRRPMQNGILSVQEKDAFNILAVIIRSMIGKIPEDGMVVYYSVPANAINTPTNADYHTKIVQSILDKYVDDGKSLKAYPINEALAIVLAELQDDQRTGISIGFGAGMVNLCYAMLAVPMVQFSVTKSGDWIDDESAKHCGETVAFINDQKKEVDLSAEPKNAVERALHYHYEIMIENALQGIKQGIVEAGSKANPGKPIKIVVAGGTASPKGFIEFFTKTLAKIEFPLEIGDIALAKDHLFTVVKGCLMAAESHSE